MDSQKFKQEAIKVTLKIMDADPIDWKTFNDNLNTIVFETEQNTPRFSVKNIKKDEKLILEYFEGNNLLHITTQRVIFNNCQMLLSNVKGFKNTHEHDNYKQHDGSYAKKHLIIIDGEDGKRLQYEIDSHHPAFFSKFLILNMSCFIKKGRWYMNPSKSYR